MNTVACEFARMGAAARESADSLLRALIEETCYALIRRIFMPFYWVSMYELATNERIVIFPYR